MAKNLYNILNVPENASNNLIRKAYYKLALIYHPDKTDSRTTNINNTEFFQEIVMAYQILSDPIKRKKYDNLNYKQKNNIFQYIKKIIKNLFDDSFINNEIKNYIISGDINNIKLYIFQKVYDKLTLNLLNNDDISTPIINKSDSDDNLDDIFISQYVIEGNCSSYETSSSVCSSDLNMQITIDTTIEEIYNNKIKELTILRHNIDQSIDEKKIYIPLYDDKLIYYKEGDEFINKNNEVDRGDINIKIKCKKHKFLKRVNDADLLLLLPITDSELNFGCSKKVKYFNESITFKLDKFSKLDFTLNNLGLPINNNKRGNLIVKFIKN